MTIIFEQIVSGIHRVTIWGILPIIFAIIIIFLMIMMICIRRETESPIKEFFHKKKSYNSEKIYIIFKFLSEMYYGICITLAIIPVILFLNKKYDLYIYEMINKIEVVSDIVIGLTTMVITMAVVIIVFDKRYYIVFSMQEVLQKYRFTKWFVVVIASCIIVSGMTMTFLNGKLDSNADFVRFMMFEIATIYNIISVIYIFYVIVSIMFLEHKKELRLLGELYRGFRLRRNDVTFFKAKENWSKEAVEINLEYLIGRYINICRRKKILKIEKIEFITTMGCCKKKWYGKAKNRFIQVMMLLFAISTLINLSVLCEKSIGLILFNIIVSIIMILISCLEIPTLQYVILRLYLDTWGYYVYSNNCTERFIPRLASRIENVYDKYIMRMNSLNAFFYIWLNYIEAKKEDIEEEFEEIFEWFEIFDKKNIILYYPIFTIGYFLFEKDIRIGKIREVYKETVVEENKQYSFQTMMNSQIFYLTKNFRKGIFDYQEKLNTYLKWLEKQSE